MPKMIGGPCSSTPSSSSIALGFTRAKMIAAAPPRRRALFSPTSSLGLLRPPGTRRWGRCDEHLSGPIRDRAFNVLDAAPFRGQHEQRSLVGPTQRARKASAVEFDPLE